MLFRSLRFGLAPRAAAKAPERAAAALPAPAGGSERHLDGRRLTVLLVEDNAVNRRLGEIVLTRRGHTVTPVDSGKAALDALKGRHFDLVLMDVQMPGMDGIETTRAIRESEGQNGGGRVPIIALTAHAMAADRERCLRAGMDGYLVKPIRPAALLDAVEEAGLEARRAAGSAESKPEEALPTELLEQLDGDTRLLGEIVDLFATESVRHLAALKDAIERGETAAFRAELHTLRGMLRGVRATAIDAGAVELQSLDPRSQKDQALEHCELLQRAVDSFGRRLARLVREVQSPVPAAQSSVPAAQSSVPAAQSSVPAAQSSVPAAQSSVPAAQSPVPAADEVEAAMPAP